MEACEKVASGVLPVMTVQLMMARIKKMFRGMGLEDEILTLSMDLPTNPTRKMGEHILRLAKYDEIIQTKSADDFLKRIKSLTYSTTFLDDFYDYMVRYGARGVKELDIATKRTSEDMTSFFHQLKSINIESSQLLEAKKRKKKGFDTLLQKAKELGKEKKFIKYATIYNDYWGYRENPKYIFILWMGFMRDSALELGAKLVKENRLDYPEQVFNLTVEQAIHAEESKSFNLKPIMKEVIESRKSMEGFKDWPKLFDSRGKIYTYKKQTEEGDFLGQAISPGIVKGRVKVLSTPYEKELLEGEILVTKSTEPAWTPVFGNASAVILDIGGPMQHGAIIAREYGIPCVSGITDAVNIFKDGDLVEVDGSNGIVKKLEM